MRVWMDGVMVENRVSSVVENTGCDGKWIWKISRFGAGLWVESHLSSSPIDWSIVLIYILRNRVQWLPRSDKKNSVVGLPSRRLPITDIGEFLVLVRISRLQLSSFWSKCFKLIVLAQREEEVRVSERQLVHTWDAWRAETRENSGFGFQSNLSTNSVSVGVLRLKMCKRRSSLSLKIGGGPLWSRMRKLGILLSVSLDDV